MSQSPAIEPILPQPSTLAGFVSRLTAFAIDCFLLTVASGLLTTMTYILFDVFGLQFFKWGRYALLTASIITASCLSFLFLPMLWHMVGSSPGKAVVGLRIVRADGRRPSLLQATLRLLGYWISGIPLFLGFVWWLFDDDHQAWHDKLAGTFVVYAPTHRSIARHA